MPLLLLLLALAASASAGLVSRRTAGRRANVSASASYQRMGHGTRRQSSAAPPLPPAPAAAKPAACLWKAGAALLLLEIGLRCCCCCSEGPAWQRQPEAARAARAQTGMLCSAAGSQGRGQEEEVSCYSAGGFLSAPGRDRARSADSAGRAMPTYACPTEA